MLLHEQIRMDRFSVPTLAPIHKSPADTGVASVVDMIRAVRITAQSSNGLSGEHERFADMSRVIRMPNAGFTRIKTCGDEPLMGGSLTSGVIAHPETGESMVQLNWGQAIDEAGGEQDVIRYVLYRIVGAGVDWGDPYLGIPGGNAAYLYQDSDVDPGVTYRYAVAAQDCTPSLSGLSASAAVTIPALP